MKNALPTVVARTESNQSWAPLASANEMCNEWSNISGYTNERENVQRLTEYRNNVFVFSFFRPIKSRPSLDVSVGTILTVQQILHIK